MNDLRTVLIFLALLLSVPGAFAHDPHLYHGESAHASETGPGPGRGRGSQDLISGQGALKFRVLYTREHLPAEAQAVLNRAHGGFAVDRRAGRGETYFALPGAGILRLSPDLQQIGLVATDAGMRDLNMHNSTIWYDGAGQPFLSFPAERAGKVFTTALDGTLLHTLEAPSAEQEFHHPEVDAYFRAGGRFTPTDVEHLGDLLYIPTGYSKLDYVLTAMIEGTKPFSARWYDLVFGGKGEAPGQFRTGHGITVPPGLQRIDVSDRPNSQVDRFTRHGSYIGSLILPQGSWPCDIDYVGDYGVVGCLHGPDRSRGAPIYVLERDRVVSTIMPKEELGLEKFQHIHNAVLRVIEGKLYILAQAWNPGDFAILEQVGSQLEN